MTQKYSKEELQARLGEFDELKEWLEHQADLISTNCLTYRESSPSAATFEYIDYDGSLETEDIALEDLLNVTKENSREYRAKRAAELAALRESQRESQAREWARQREARDRAELARLQAQYGTGA